MSADLRTPLSRVARALGKAAAEPPKALLKAVLVDALKWRRSRAVPILERFLVGRRARSAERVERFRRYLLGRAVDALDGFEKALVAAAGEQGSRLTGIYEDENVRIVLEDLAPLRISAAKRYLSSRDLTAVSALPSFIEGRIELLRGQAAAATDAEDLGAALLDALESLHSFLLARQLVSSGYKLAERHDAGRDRAVQLALERHPPVAHATPSRGEHVLGGDDLTRVPVS